MNSATITALAAISGSSVRWVLFAASWITQRHHGRRHLLEKQPVLKDFSDTCRGELESMNE
jgi:hypothetical protein